MKSKPNPMILGYVGFVSVFLIIGLVLVFFGAKDSFASDRETRDYQKTTAYLSDYTLKKDAEYDPVKKRKSAATYTLEYHYTVDGAEYTVFTDYSTSILPELGSTRDVRYSPKNPRQSVLTGPGRNFAMVFLGALFSLAAAFFLWPVLAPDKKKKQTAFQPMLFLFGFLFFLFGYGALYMITGEVSPIGIFQYYTDSFVFPLLIPPLLIVAGVFACIQSFHPFKAGKEQKRNQKKNI